MSKSSMRIVLVDPLGDILFSGDSLRARQGEALTAPAAPKTATATETERCPETLRSAVSSESGFYRTVERRSSVVIDETSPGPITTDDGPATRRRLPAPAGEGRAA